MHPGNLHSFVCTHSLALEKIHAVEHKNYTYATSLLKLNLLISEHEPDIDLSSHLQLVLANNFYNDMD